MVAADWRPVLTDAEGRRALAFARSVAERVGSVPGDPTLGSGLAGAALLHHALHVAEPDGGHFARAQAAIRDATLAMSGLPLPAGLLHGYAGVGFAAAWVGGAPRTCAAIDAALLRRLQEWTYGFDLVGGLVGAGLYALERGTAGREILEMVVSELANSVIQMPVGLSWPGAERATPVRLGPSNLGVAHGTPGVVALLGRSVGVGEARTLLDGAVAHVLDARCGPVGRRFPHSVGGNADPRPARTAWCYGDPGVAAALWVAAEGTGDDGWRSAALELARDAALVSAEEGRVVDENLCHGAAGLGLVFHRLGAGSGDPALLASARRWYLTALDRPHPTPTSALLTGELGVALALLAAATRHEPGWDRFLGVSGHHDAT